MCGIITLVSGSESQGVPVRRIMIVALSLVLSGCLFGDDVTSCECPMLKSAAAEIDWLGNAAEVRRMTDWSGGTYLFPLEATVWLESASVEADMETIVRRLEAAGFGPAIRYEESTGWAWRIEDVNAQWIVEVKRLASLDVWSPAVSVLMIDDDDRANEILAPLVDTLGSLP